jgi:ParB/RepB/Spo0J family partition protein
MKKPTETFTYVALKLIDSVKHWNPRTQFEKAKLEELAADIKTNGIIQPLVLRKNGRRYQIIVGERRYRAAKIAKLDKVPAMVRELENAAAFQQTLSENLNRVDLHPVEEAQGFGRLRDEYDLPPKEIARRTGKTIPYVVNRLQLTTLAPPVAEEAMAMGDKLPLGHLQLVAQIGGGEVQHQFLVQITKAPYGRGLVSYDDAKKILGQYQRPLSTAQFVTTDPNLTSAPACPACPQNTTNLPREVFGVKELCTNIRCFIQKQRARMKQIVEEGDYSLIKDAQKLFPYQHNDSPMNEYVDLHAKRYDNRGNSDRTWGQWFKQRDGEYAPQMFVVMSPHSHRIVYVAKRNEAEAAVAQLKKLDPGVKRSNGLQRRKKSASEIEGERKRKATKTALDRVTLKIRDQLRKFGTLEEYNLALLALIAGLKHNFTFGEAMAEAAKSRGIELSDSEKKKSGYQVRQILADRMVERSAGMTGGELLALALEVTVLRQANAYDSSPAERTAAVFGVDFKEEVKRCLNELAEKTAKAKPGKAAAAGA